MDILFFGLIVWAFIDVSRGIKTTLGVSREVRIAEREQQLAPRQMSPSQRRATAARHDTGWWLREIFTGFPTARHGWHAGWVAHQAAVEQQRGIVDHHRSLRDRWHAARLQGLKNEVELARGDVQAAGDDRPPLSRAEMKERLKAGSPPAQPRPDDPVTAAKAAHPASQPAGVFTTDGPPMAVPPEPAAAGGSGTPPAAPPRPEAISDPGPVPAPIPEPVPQIRQGAPMPVSAPAEFTYDQALQAAQDAMTLAETHQAELAKLGIPQMVDTMSASGLDGGTLSRLADLATAHESAVRSSQAMGEHAQALRDGLQRDHGSVNEAHQAAPEGGAEKSFYAPA